MRDGSKLPARPGGGEAGAQAVKVGTSARRNRLLAMCRASIIKSGESTRSRSRHAARKSGSSSATLASASSASSSAIRTRSWSMEVGAGPRANELCGGHAQ